MNAAAPLGVYVHVPFCAQKCAYCDFAIITGQAARADEYFAALAEEIDAFAARHGRPPADSIHFGGGTPSHVPPALIAATIARLAAALDLAPDAEIGLEANPEDVTPASLAEWRAGGVNRLTIGVQSLRDAGLAALGRPGEVATARRALDDASRSGIASIGADLIFGRPGQDPADWERELEEVVGLPVQHLSLYALETDAKTPLVRSIEKGAAPRPDPDDAATMYDAAVLRLAEAGFARYEISNFARPGHASRHNTKYWTDAPYIGFGQAASSYVDGARWTNPRRYSEYLGMGRGLVPPPEVEPYDADRRAGEAFVFGLRLVAGIDLDVLANRHGAEAVGRREPALANAARLGLVIREGSRVRLADHAFLVADEIFVDLL